MSLNLIDPIRPGTQATTTTTASKQTLNKQDFLNLLVAQLKNQDPLNPVEGTDYTAQLAQFSSLEQLMDINDSLKQASTQRTSLENMEALGFVGKRVKAVGDKLGLGESGAADGRYSLETTGDVAIGIYDPAGKLVRTMKVGWTQPGDHAFQWDGLSSSGTRCAAGTYSFVVAATGPDGQVVTTTTYSLGTVTGVNLSGTEPRLIIGTGGGGTEVALSDLTEVVN